MDKKTIFVTQPSLPELDDFIPYLRKIWENKWLTNNGEFHKKFEAELAEYLGVKYVSLFTNGMIALQVGMQALRITGEVITTPFTFVATTLAIHWNSCKPVFCDIEPDTYTMDPAKVEAKYGPRRAGDIPHSLADIGKAKKLLGYAPEFSVRDGLKQTAEWYHRNLRTAKGSEA